MRTLASLLAVAAITAIGLAGTAHADEWADAVESFSNVTNDGNATGANDSAFAVLGDTGTLTVKFTDNTCLADTGNDLEIFDGETLDGELYNVRTALEGQDLVSLGDVNETDGTTELNVSSAFTRVRVTDADIDVIDGAEFDAFRCLNNLAFGTDHINKAITAGGSSIVINSKNGADAQQFYSFEIVITNPDGADLSGFIFHDTVPGEFDITAVTPDNSNVNLALRDGCDNVSFAEHKPGKKLSPDKITWDVELAAGESCTLDVDVETSRKNTSPKKVNWAPTECPAGGVVLNEGVEVSDANGDTILIDDSSLVLTCVDPPADPD